MTRDEFNKQSFGRGDKLNYDGCDRDIISVSFTEGIFGIDDCDDIDNLSWVRCESGIFIPFDAETNVVK